MNRSDIKSIIALSGSDFYRKIIKKYQIGKITAFRFPTMIFSKNRGYFFHKKIDMKILFQTHLINQNILFPLIGKIIPAMRGTLSRLDAGKKTLQTVLKPKNISNVNNIKNFLPSDFVINLQTAHIIPSSNIMVNPQIFHYFHNVEILNPQTFRVRKNCLYHRPLDTVELLLGINTISLKDQNQLTVNKPFKKNYFGNFRSDPSNYFQRTYTYKTGYYDRQFKLPAVLPQDNLFSSSIIFGINKLLFNYLSRVTVNKPLIKNSNGSLRNISSNSIQRTYLYKIHFYDRQSEMPAILSQNNILFNSTMMGISSYSYKELDWVTVNKPLIKNYFGSNRYNPYSSVQRTYSYKTSYYSSKSESPAVLSHNNTFSNSMILRINKLLFNYQNLVTVNKPLIKNSFDSFRYISPDSAQRTYAYKIESEIMRFQDSGHLEQEIEKIKKIVIQTKESISEKTKPSFGEAEIKRYIDINRISDQVYRNIERAIRMERERRGM